MVLTARRSRGAPRSCPTASTTTRDFRYLGQQVVDQRLRSHLRAQRAAEEFLVVGDAAGRVQECPTVEEPHQLRATLGDVPLAVGMDRRSAAMVSTG